MTMDWTFRLFIGVSIAQLMPSMDLARPWFRPRYTVWGAVGSMAMAWTLLSPSVLATGDQLAPPFWL